MIEFLLLSTHNLAFFYADIFVFWFAIPFILKIQMWDICKKAPYQCQTIDWEIGNVKGLIWKHSIGLKFCCEKEILSKFASASRIWEKRWLVFVGNFTSFLECFGGSLGSLVLSCPHSKPFFMISLKSCHVIKRFWLSMIPIARLIYISIYWFSLVNPSIQCLRACPRKSGQPATQAKFASM